MSVKRDTCVVIPVYGHFDYAARAVRSCLASSDRTWVLILDDASPDYEVGLASFLTPILKSKEASDRVACVHHEQNQGLTAMWNAGLHLARNNSTYICCGNSDLVFTPGWDGPLREWATKYPLVGPVTNTPGTEPGQFVGNFLQNYKVSDRRSDLNATAESLRRQCAGDVRVGPINGFCMFGRTDSWWKYAHDEQHVFDPKNRMTLQEYQLQKKIRKLGGQTAYVPASFVFHYRAVTRGEKFRRGAWLRNSNPNQEV